MVKTFTNILFFVLAFFGATVYGQEISFEAYPSKQTVAQGEVFDLNFSVEQTGSSVDFNLTDIKFPSFSDFEYIAKFATQSKLVTNGQFSQRTGVRIRVRAPKKGKFTIGKAMVFIKGKRYFSKPFTVNVSDSGASTGGSSSASGTGSYTSKDNTLFVVTSVDNTNPYVQQGVVLRVKVYSRSMDALRRMVDLTPPGLAGFSNHTIDTDSPFTQETYKGMEELAKPILWCQRKEEVFGFRQASLFILTPKGKST
ncbi:MAG: hypothetical protein C4K58_00800 [Flavobacteriaceae bacterium]|nr:MAG: hypothetical protein C4K58_00800 [Flavobacteriaceae bacterium]